MAEQAKITILTDHEGNPIAPKTAANAVSYEDQTVGGALASLQEELDGHTDNTDAHITAEERAAWNGKASGDHTHDTENIVSGILPVARGGTGQTSLTNVTVGKANACNGLTFAIAASAPTAVTNNKVTFVYE